MKNIRSTAPQFKFKQDTISKALYVAERHNKSNAPFDIETVNAIIYITECIKHQEFYKERGHGAHAVGLEEEIRTYKTLLLEEDILTDKTANKYLRSITNLLVKWEDTIKAIEEEYKERRTLAKTNFIQAYIQNHASAS